ncbi:MAG TPA: UMP kinase [Candidatus Nanoarchaeia archaeon]|nr:UMP kinase [Candidatus Nanoarchaeia archaeon]
MAKRKLVILSLGGSIIVPDRIDTAFLKEFRSTLLSLLPKYRFIIVCGGGKVCRDYIAAAKSVREFDDKVYDHLGIKITEANAQLVLSVLHDVAHAPIHPDYRDVVAFADVLIGCGFLPGTSTDFDAVKFAEHYGGDTVINLSNIAFVYDKDPKKHKEAKRIERISWGEFRKLVGDEWKAGMNLPFDPIASKRCEELGIRVVIMDGRNLQNFRHYLGGKGFQGTVIG